MPPGTELFPSAKLLYAQSRDGTCRPGYSMASRVYPQSATHFKDNRHTPGRPG